jgi:hypothetical protein
MSYLELSFFQTIAGIFHPIFVILVRKILTEEGTPALHSKQTSFQNGLKKECNILQISLLEKVF